nr:MAG TPA: hypothetical protein [Caudoviricetes sp.]
MFFCDAFFSKEGIDLSNCRRFYHIAYLIFGYFHA